MPIREGTTPSMYQGVGITLSEFFNVDYFNDLDE